MECGRRLRSQPDRARLARGKLAGTFFVDVGLDPDGGRVDQGEDRVARLDDRARFGMAGDKQRIKGREQPVMAEKGFLLPQGGRRIEALCPDHGHIRLGHRQIGAGHVRIALRFLGALDRGHIALRQPLQPLVRDLALRQHDPGPHQRRFGPGKIGLVRCHRGPGADNTRFLHGRVEDGQFLPLGHAVAGIGGKPGQGGAHLEADAAEYLRLYSAEPVDAKGHIMFGLNDRHRHWAFGEEQKAGSDSRC